MLEHDADELEVAFLTKQLKLMKNLLNDYTAEISRDTRLKLVNTLQLQHTVLEENIQKEPGRVRKKNAAGALTSLMSFIQNGWPSSELKAA